MNRGVYRTKFSEQIVVIDNLVKPEVRKWLCVVGGFLTMLSFSVAFSFTNISTYLISYMRNESINGLNNYLTYEDFIYFTTAKYVVQYVGMPFIGVLCRKMGPRLSVFIGSSILSFGFMVTYFSIRSYYAVAILTLGLHGVGFWFIYGTTIGTAQKWFPKSKKGLMGSIVLSAYGFGSLIWTPLETAFVNPDDVEAEYDPQCNKTEEAETEYDCKNLYYKDPDLLARVPLMFVMLGGIFAVLGVTGTVLISEPDEQFLAKLEEEEPSRALDEEKHGRNLKPMELLKTVVFYLIWTGFFVIDMANGLMMVYQKPFGLTFINSDSYFATTAVVQNIFNGSCRIFWGFLYDRFGFKNCFLAIGIGVTVVTLCLPALPMLEDNSIEAKIAFGIAMILLFSLFPGVYAVMAAGVNEAFGSDYFEANFGLMFTQGVANQLLIVMMTQIPVIYDSLGYTGMFLVTGGLGVIGVLITCFLPQQIKSTNNVSISNAISCLQTRKS